MCAHVTNDMDSEFDFVDRTDAMYFTATPLGSFLGSQMVRPPHIGKIKPETIPSLGFDGLLPILAEKYGWTKCITGIAEIMSGVKYSIINPQEFVAHTRSLPSVDFVRSAVNSAEGMEEVNWFLILLDEEENEWQYFGKSNEITFAEKAPLKMF